MSISKVIHTPYATFDPEVLEYSRFRGDTELMIPRQYTDWLDETLSWKKSCYLHVGLSGPMADLKVKGKDAEKLMSETFVNNFSLEKFHVGRCKHCIAVSSRGYITMHGICLRTAEDEFHTYSLDPQVPMQVNSGKYDVEQYVPEYNKDFVFQMAGPRSLELVENVLQEDIHDMKFMEFRNYSVLGRPVRVLRMGMGGTLAYEFHGAIEDALPVYDEIIRVGKKYDLKRLGMISYMLNHTENGFPQLGKHFMSDWSDPDVLEYMASLGSDEEDSINIFDSGRDLETDGGTPLHGSLKDLGEEAYYANPFELGWGKMVSFAHDFHGKEALEKIANDPKTRKICTLEWNSQDILQIFAGYLDDDENLPDPFSFPYEYYFEDMGNLQDKVFNAEGKLIGRSCGYEYTAYYKKCISLCTLDPEYLKEGNEVTILWGTSGTRQFKIRAKVARYPYLDLANNREYDIDSIPRFKK